MVNFLTSAALNGTTSLKTQNPTSTHRINIKRISITMISTSIRPEPHIAIPPILRFRRIGGYFYLLCCAVILCFFRLFRLFMRLRARVHSGFPQQIARLAVRTYASPQKRHDITNPLFAALGSGLWLSSSGVGSSASFFAKVNQHISNTECTSAANTIFRVLGSTFNRMRKSGIMSAIFSCRSS